MLNDQQEGRAGGFNAIYKDKLMPLFKKPQNIAAAGLGVFGVFVIFMWFMQMKAMIRDPLTMGGNGDSENYSDDSAENTVPQNADSDSDGLTDAEELGTYKTSPYLEDSDSDGFTDKEELDSGNDPNCPTGKQCGISPIENADAEIDETEVESEEGSTQEEILDKFQSAGDKLMSSDSAQEITANPGSATQEEYEKLISGQVDAATLRRIMIERGADKSQLDKLTDEQLMKSYKDVFTNNSASE